MRMAMTSKMVRLAAGIALLAVATNAWANDYYVAPNGNDKNPGTLNRPWANPVTAAARLKAGDTLYFREGLYRCRTNGTVGLAPACDGQKGNPITFANYKNEHVRIDVAGTNWGVTNNGFSYIVFDGFEIFGGTRKHNVKFGANHSGSRKGYGHHVTLRNCEVVGAAGPNILAANTPNLLIENVLTHQSQRSHGLYLSEGCHDSVIRRVTSRNNQGNSGIQINAANGGVRNVLVERCLLQGNSQGFSLMGNTSCVFRNNVLWNNGFDGPRGTAQRETIVWTYGNAVCEDVLFENNTFVNVVPEGHKLAFLIQSTAGSKNVTFRNNVLVARGKPIFGLESFEGFVFENNCLLRIGGGEEVKEGGTLAEFAKAQGLMESNNLAADPLFEDIDAGDFRLKQGSPCIDAGVKTDSQATFVGKARDIGALEHGDPGRIGCQLPWIRR